MLMGEVMALEVWTRAPSRAGELEVVCVRQAVNAGVAASARCAKLSSTECAPPIARRLTRARAADAAPGVAAMPRRQWHRDSIRATAAAGLPCAVRLTELAPGVLFERVRSHLPRCERKPATRMSVCL